MAATRKRTTKKRRTSASPARRRTTKRRPSSRRKTKRRPAKSRGKRKASRRYGSTARKKVQRSMHEVKEGKLRSGRSKKKVRSRKQAIAIGLSEARREGGKVPPKRRSGRSSSAR